MEQSLIEFTKNISEHHTIQAYIFFFISACLQILFPPYPGDTLLILEGYLSSQNYFNKYLIVLNAAAATYLSSLILYHISYKLGDRVFELNFISKYFPKDKINKLTEWFKKYGAASILFSKFVPGIGSLVIIVAGTFKVPIIKAYTALAAAAVAHNSLLVFIGRAAGDNMELIKAIFRKYNMIIIAITAVLAVVYWSIKLYKKSKQSQKGV